MRMVALFSINEAGTPSLRITKLTSIPKITKPDALTKHWTIQIEKLGPFSHTHVLETLIQ
jgi:hypothetical protein